MEEQPLTVWQYSNNYQSLAPLSSLPFGAPVGQRFKAFRDISVAQVGTKKNTIEAKRSSFGALARRWRAILSLLPFRDAGLPAHPEQNRRPERMHCTLTHGGHHDLQRQQAELRGSLSHPAAVDIQTSLPAPAGGQRARRSVVTGKTYALLTDIGVGAAVLSAAGTAILYFTAPKSTVGTKTGQRRFVVEPTIAPSQAGLAVSGQF
jgi:hypothetical protein